ncbi:MAG: hypothetical protein QOK02_778 [Mycobacterium sp.]|jgi:hypothetical protein|nr:hypothetical protein [Mycobacterium sp.]
MIGTLNWLRRRVDDVTDQFAVWFRRGNPIPFEQVMRDLELADALGLPEPRPE